MDPVRGGVHIDPWSWLAGRPLTKSWSYMRTSGLLRNTTSSPVTPPPPAFAKASGAHPLYPRKSVFGFTVYIIKVHKSYKKN